MEYSVDEMRKQTENMIEISEEAFKRSAETFKYLIAGMGALSFTIVSVAPNYINKGNTYEALLLIASLSVSLFCVCYCYFGMHFSFLGIFGQQVTRFNIRTLDVDKLIKFREGLLSLIDDEVRSVHLKRAAYLCGSAVLLSLLAFAGVLLW
ncbi:hypothetical protein GVN24_00275 [Rhizobium sp. CRIBSB]|nr:hypothetical protein [Rhizobium sp. CRIBSB]